MAQEIKCFLSVSIDEGMEDGEVPLNGYGDCHEDADGEEDVVERKENVRIEIVMNLSHSTNH